MSEDRGEIASASPADAPCAGFTTYDYLEPLGATPESAFAAFVSDLRSATPTTAADREEHDAMLAAAIAARPVTVGSLVSYQSHDASGLLAKFDVRASPIGGYVVDSSWLRLSEKFCISDEKE